MKKRIESVTICSSGSFYRKVVEIERELARRGFRVRIPATATAMKKSGDFKIEKHKTWLKNPSEYGKKARKMRDHNRKIAEGDAVLIVNEEKNGVPGYIGGNVLMEMALAFHLRKPIFILHPVPASSPFLEEIMGMHPVFLNGDLAAI